MTKFGPTRPDLEDLDLAAEAAREAIYEGAHMVDWREEQGILKLAIHPESTQAESAITLRTLRLAWRESRTAFRGLIARAVGNMKYTLTAAGRKSIPKV